ncbi:MAG: diguanylate cyclase [Deltaproteobacteria bacterium]|nr:diguanylate cyclase [Deltaproteobacteria bacterium]
MKPAHRLRILVVDDHEDSRALFQMLLAGMGHDCSIASNGVEAWSLQQATPFDIILSDWKMPEMTGLELCRLVRTQHNTLYTYFVFMTAFGDKARFLEGMRAGADDYLTKPIDLEELEARLASAQRVLEMQHELAERNVMLHREGDLAFTQARLDPLTQTANRLRLREDLEIVQAAVGDPRQHFCIALCDLDKFKNYNDTFGHVAGDAALKRVAAAMRGTLRQADVLYRYGGEEFLIILTEHTLEGAQRTMNRVRDAVEKAGVEYPDMAAGVLTVSIGVTELTPDTASEDWIRRADAALYVAKAKGRNQVVAHEEDISAAHASEPA